MARVFAKPHYVNTDKLLAVDIGKSSAIKGNNVYLESLMYFRNSALDSPEIEDEVVEWAQKRKEDRATAFIRLSQEILKLAANRPIICDQDAVFALFEKIHDTPGLVSKDKYEPYLHAETSGKEIAAWGMIGSFASPGLAIAGANSIHGISYLIDNHPCYAQMIPIADALRLNVTNKVASNAIREFFSFPTALEISDCYLSDSALGGFFTGMDLYAMGPWTVFCERNRVIVLSKETRDTLATVCASAAGWVLAGANHHVKAARDAAIQGAEYVFNSIRDKPVCDKIMLARQMKTSYAIILARYGYRKAKRGEKALIDKQVSALLVTARAEARGERLWCDVVCDWDEDVAVDLGCAWNIIPPADSDIRQTNAAAQNKMNALRNRDKAAEDDFIEYARSALLAHFLVRNKDATVEWDDDSNDAENLGWVIACRTGELNYPTTKDRRVGGKCYSWVRHLETWGYTAQDVTHIYADKNAYSDLSKFAETARYGMSELVYFVQNYMTLSGQYTPEAIRDAIFAGWAPGDRVLYEAVKSENTKVPGKQRETMSADDILREVLTEIDINLSRVASDFHGVAMRAGRRGLEKKIAKLANSNATEQLLISLDVSGWSPNMNRDLELRFIDMILSLFDVPDSFKASSIFRDVTVVASKGAYHSLWDMENGSVQGFFGTADSIMHSMMAQWIVHDMKSRGMVDKRMKMDKVTLIDDIVALISHIEVDPQEIVDHFVAGYKRLGFEVDPVKTIARSTNMHFLNRLYANRREVLTCSKIYARIDREWDRRWVSIFNEIDACFASAAGASDRGYNPVACYVTACIRASHRARATGAMPTQSLFNLVSAWLPRSMMGLGFPSFSAWVTREGSSTMETAVATVYVIYDHLAALGHFAADLIMDTLQSIADAELDVPKPSRYIDDPLSVRLKAASDPSNVLRSLARKAIDRMDAHPAVIKMLGLTPDSGYEDLIYKTVTGTVYPCDVVTEFAASLPHAITHALVEKLIGSDTIINMAPRRDKEAAWKEFRRRNIAAALGVARLDKTYIGKRPFIPSAAAFCSYIRSRQSTAVRIVCSGSIAPAASDIIRQVRPIGGEVRHAPIVVTAKCISSERMAIPTDKTGPEIVRTVRPTSASMSMNIEGRDKGPLFSAFARLMGVTAVAAATNSDDTHLRKVWSLAWTGSLDFVPTAGATTSAHNPMRVCNRFRIPAHTISAWPNYIGKVKVDANKAITYSEGKHRTFSWLSVVYFLRAAAALDATLSAITDISLGNILERGYDLRPMPEIYRACDAWHESIDDFEYTYEGYAGGTFRGPMNALKSSISSAFGNIRRELEEESSESGDDDPDYADSGRFPIKIAVKADRRAPSAAKALSLMASGTTLRMDLWSMFKLDDIRTGNADVAVGSTASHHHDTSDDDSESSDHDGAPAVTSVPKPVANQVRMPRSLASGIEKTVRDTIADVALKAREAVFGFRSQVNRDSRSSGSGWVYDAVGYEARRENPEAYDVVPDLREFDEDLEHVPVTTTATTTTTSACHATSHTAPDDNVPAPLRRTLIDLAQDWRDFLTVPLKNGFSRLEILKKIPHRRKSIHPLYNLYLLAAASTKPMATDVIVLRIMSAINRIWENDDVTARFKRCNRYTDWAAKYMAISEDVKVAAVPRYLNLFLFPIMAQWASLTTDDFNGAVQAILDSIFTSASRIMHRAKVAGVNQYEWAEIVREEKAGLYHPAVFFHRCLSCIKRVIPADFKARDDIIKGFKKGVDMAHSWAVADFSHADLAAKLTDKAHSNAAGIIVCQAFSKLDGNVTFVPVVSKMLSDLAAEAIAGAQKALNAMREEPSEVDNEIARKFCEIRNIQPTKTHAQLVDDDSWIDDYMMFRDLEYAQTGYVETDDGNADV